MKPTSAMRFAMYAMAALLALPWLTSPARAQLAASGTPGDRVVYTVGFPGLTIADTPAPPGNSLVHEFDTEEVPDNADSFDLGATGVVSLTAGHHIVLHGTYFTSVNDRASTDTFLKLNGTAIPYGAASGYTRDTAHNDLFSRGGTILNVAQGDTIELETQREDGQADNQGARAITEQAADLQFIKLDDASLDFLRLGAEFSSVLMPNQEEGPLTVIYDVQDELDTDSFGHDTLTNADQVVLKTTGHYLVFANTGFIIAGTTNRNELKQQIKLGGSPVPGGATGIYLRNAGNGDGAGAYCREGTISIGVLVEVTTPDTILEVEISRDNNNSNSTVTIDPLRTGLAIAKLPAYGNYISLTGGPQNVNTAAPTPLDFSASGNVSNGSFSYSPASSGSAISVNQAADYLFLSSHWGTSTPATQTQRMIVRQDFQTSLGGGAAFPLGYGGGGIYNRDDHAGVDQARNSGTWAGAVINGLQIGDTVETTTEALGGDTATETITTSSLGIQGLNIDSISNPPLNPVVSLSGPLNVLVSSAGTTITDETHLLTSDANTGPANLTYTITSAITGGTLRLNGTPLATNGMFSQEEVNNDLLTFDAAASEQAGGFDFSVSDGGGSPATGTFDINVGVTTLLADDNGATDEDSLLTAVDPGGAEPSLLANDAGTGLAVVAFDAASALGATVSVAGDGTFTYDPTASATLQALAIGEQGSDSFTYTVTDFQGNTSLASANIQVDGLNDSPLNAADESVTSANGGIVTINLLANEIEIDASDILTVSEFMEQFGGGGAVPTDTFNFAFVPLVFTTDEGATVSISADGILTYDPGTSSNLLGLGPGDPPFVKTFVYDVSDGTTSRSASIIITSVGLSLPTKDYATTDADSAIAGIDVLANDSISGAAGTPTPGALLDLNAADVGNTDSNWANSGGEGGALVMEGAGTQSVLITPANAPIGITAAYDLSGSGSGDQILATDDAGNLYGSNIGNADATIEAVFRPDAQTADQPIWGSGGNGTGSSLVLLGNQVIYTVGQNAIAGQVRGTIPAGAVAGGDYVHAVGTLNLGTDTLELYINNVLVDSFVAVDFGTGLPGNLTDWSGTDDEGIGRSAGTTGGDINVAPFLGNFGTVDIPDFNDGAQRFAGELAVVRVYSGVLTPSEVNTNFEAVFGVGSPAAVGDITDLAGGGVPSVGNPVQLASGATVTLAADGTFTYDPNGAFDDLGQGLTARDSFTYTLNSGFSPVVTVNVDVTGTNTDPQITIAADQADVSEGSSATFTVSASSAVSGPVNVALSFDGLADRPEDFTGVTTVQIPNGGMSVPLSLTTINDNLFEGLENIVVEIDSVSGNAAVGGTTAAESLLTDVQTAPEFAIAENQASAPEGTVASFIVGATVPSQEERTLNVSYSGTAVDGSDFFGQSTVVIPGGSDTGNLEIIPFDDGLPEGTESLTVTLDSVDVGTIGAPASASTDVIDGAGKLVFLADFEGIDPADTPGGTLLSFDAPAAADLGTPIGSWSGIFTITSGGNEPGVITEGDDVKGDTIDHSLRLDRPGPADGDIFAIFAASADLSGTNTAVLSIDLGTRRTQNDTQDKSYSLIGLDDAGEKSFELFVDASNTGNFHEQVFHVDSGGTMTPLGAVEDFNNTGNYNESRQSRLFLSLTSTGYTVAVDRFPLDGNYDSITPGLSYAGPATQIARVHFQLSGSDSTGVSSGMYLDDFSVSGIAGNIPPTATLGGVGLANGNSSALPDSFIGTGTLLDTLQVDDVDAGAGTVTATFQSSGAAPLTFTGSGPAAVGGDGTGTLTLTGTLSDVKASLTAGVTYTTNAVTGGDASIAFTIDDGGNTGAGGPKSLTHNLSFFVNEGPTVTVDLAPGQSATTTSSPIEFEVVFSEAVTGFGGGDVDFSASTETGPLSASVSGAGDTYIVSVTGMSGGGKVTISVPKGAASAVAGGAATEASKAINDTVTFVAELPPTATNLTQSINYDTGPVDIADIVVSDPNDSVVTTLQAPQYDFPATHGDALDLTPDPDTDAGFAFEVAFLPGGFDDFGTVRVIEIGGTSNGTGIYLLDGIPHLVSKMNSAPDQIPAGLNDTDWDDGNVSVPLTTAMLPLDVPARIAVIASLDAVSFSVNGSGETTVPLTNRDARSDWSGDDTIRVGQNPDGGRGGLGMDLAGIFDDVGSFPMEGTVSLARLWHAPDASGFSIQAVGAPEEITATLNVTPGEGDLSEPAGATYNAGTGTWTITGTLGEVNAALAAVQFLPNGTSPVTIGVTIDDGDEDGSGPLVGSIVLTTGGPQDSDNDGIPDGYEIANGLNPNDGSDARSDGDNDGWDALSEYLMGTAANNRAEVPVFEINHVNATRVEITYGPILAGRTYEVLASSTGEPLPPAIDSFNAAADGATNTAIDTTGGELSEIYRLRVTVPGP